ADAQGPSLRSMSEGVQQMVKRISPAVVRISSVGIGVAQENDAAKLLATSSTGSGVIVDPQGYIVTNAHVVGSARRVHVMLSPDKADRERFHSVLKPAGVMLPATVLGVDRETDVAVLKIERNGLPFLKFADSESIQQGQFVFAAGSPFGLDNSI